MRGKVLAFDFKSGEGHISGDDGNRYSFNATDWNGDRHPSVGETADFQAEDGRATAIYRVSGAGPMSAEKSRIVAALLAFFLGLLGIHKFYMGKTTAGVIMLVCGTIGWLLLFIPPMIIGVIAFIEFIIYLVMSDDDFQRKYIDGDQSWF